MNFVGRITKDAVVSTVKDDRKVVNFTVALNDYYKPKGSEQGVKVTTFINCSYWISPAIALQLTKGSLVEINGRLHASAYVGFDKEAKASLNCHANSIKIHQFMKSDVSSKSVVKKEEPVDDLPF